MARAIDADRLKQAIDHDYYEHYTKYHDSDQTALIDMVMDDIDEIPTLTPPNEPLTCEGCAEGNGSGSTKMGLSVLAHTARDGQQIATAARRRYRHETPIHTRRGGIHHPGDLNLY